MTKEERVVNISVKPCHDNAQLPTKNKGDVGWDIYCVADDNFSLYISDNEEDTEPCMCYTLNPGYSHLFHTGITTSIPDGYAALLWDRSGPSL